jgi:chorismate mutase-like protein
MDISDWRQRIDELDEQIVRLLNQRAEAAKAIGELKQKGSLPVYEPKREQVVFEHVSRSNPGPLSNPEIVDIYQRIIDVMRAIQKHD